MEQPTLLTTPKSITTAPLQPQEGMVISSRAQTQNCVRNLSINEEKQRALFQKRNLELHLTPEQRRKQKENI